MPVATVKAGKYSDIEEKKLTAQHRLLNRQIANGNSIAAINYDAIGQKRMTEDDLALRLVKQQTDASVNKTRLHF